MTTSGKVFDTRKGTAGHNSGKASDATRSIKLRGQAAKCLWSCCRFLTMSTDEVHEMRNLSSNFYATLEISKVSIVKLLLSGTPLYTSPKVRLSSLSVNANSEPSTNLKDLCNLGRLARILYFVGKDGDDREKEYWKKLRAARRALTREDKQEAAAHTIQWMAGDQTEYQEHGVKIPIHKVTSSWIVAIKRGYDGRVIRRTVESKTFDGRKINDTLVPYTMVIVPVHLDKTELEINISVMNQITGS
jgi:hypothetical protein